MPVASTWQSVKSKPTQPSLRPNNNTKVLGNKKNDVYVQNAKRLVKTSALSQHQNKQPIKKWIVITNDPEQKCERENNKLVNKNPPFRKFNDENYENSFSAKIQYHHEKRTVDNTTRTSVLKNDIDNVSTENGTVLNKGCVPLRSHYHGTNQIVTNNNVTQMELARFPSYSSTSTQSSLTDQTLYNGCDIGSQPTNYTSPIMTPTEEQTKESVCEQDENVQGVKTQYWITSLYDIYLVTQKFNRSENMHNNYLDTIRYVILAIWDTSYGIEFHDWMEQVLQMSGTNCRIIELALYYLLRFKRCLSHSNVESYKFPRKYIHNYSRFTVSKEPCPKSPDSIKSLPALVSSIILAWKFYQDENFRTHHWAYFTGYSAEQLNVFERDFLRMIDYNVFIKENSFKQWLRFLHSHMQAICGPGLNVRFAYFLPQNRGRINEFMKSLKMLNIEEMERIMKENVDRGKKNERVHILNLEDIKRVMEKS
ncbi:23_t:CDS:2 [Funneliformis geosporum]|uniref:18502_t:CDS:1 n=1 Tax=Funneliformis geosporum TaxID=1117311 RepID=A0A9W4SH74_9GLOM|nr:23_t:CDS:2 [Funneliformis geosporum]CAI2169346.1 18502_t:CDS:2 [Funneliformis geosporum]